MFGKKILKNKLNFLLFIGILIGSFLILEFINFLIPKENYSVWLPNYHREFLPDTNIIKGIDGKSAFSINALGYRGEMIKDISGEYRILVVGGSSTESLYLDNYEAWPDLISRELKESADGRKVITINIGKSGHNTRDHIIQLRHLIKKYEPNMVILMIGANDMLLKLSKRDA